MGKMLIILISGAFVLYSIGNLNINQSNTAMIGNAVDQYETAQASNYAESGIDYAVSMLSQDTTWSGVNNKVISNGTVSISVVNTAAKYYQGSDVGLTRGRLITAIGTQGSHSDTVRAVIQLPSSSGSSSSSAPPFMNYAIASGNSLHMNGNVTVTDDNNNNLNANVHTNSNFAMNGNNKIDGFLTYGGNAHSNPASRLNTSIVPNQNPDNLPNHQKVDPLDIPSFNPDDYKDVATQVYNTNKTFSGNISLGTKENPEIIYVGGDLQITGNVSGYGVFIVKGNILINGNVTITSIDPTGNNLGLYSKGDINVNGNVTLKAQLLASSNINLGGNTKVYGSVTAKGHINFNGNVSIYYRAATPELTSPFWPVEGAGPKSTRPAIISYYH